MKVVRATERAGVRRRKPPTGMLVHVTGSGVFTRAKRKHTSAILETVEMYKHGRVFPDALIGWDGTIYTFTAGDMIRSAHATWRPWERALYAKSSGWRDNNFSSIWARDYHDRTIGVPAIFYRDWFARWQDAGRYYRSPIEIVEKVGGPRATPNATYYGVELLSLPEGIVFDTVFSTIDGISYIPMLIALADLFIEQARKHGWLDPTQIEPNTLPQPWLCGHDDLCPARRWKRSGRGGVGWDPGPKFPWRMLGELICGRAKGTPR